MRKDYGRDDGLHRTHLDKPIIGCVVVFHRILHVVKEVVKRSNDAKASELI